MKHRPEKLANLVRFLLRQRGKVAFLQSLPRNAKLLDVGCGNDSPLRIKKQRPDITYTGVDVGDYNQSQDVRLFAEEYIVVTSKTFADEIGRRPDFFDAVICAHNLEHCYEPKHVLAAIAKALKKGGRLYLSFPSEASVRFPSRAGTLNFWDDKSHISVPDFTTVIDLLRTAGLDIDFSSKRYRPLLLALIGLMLEPISILTRRCMPLGSTWALYGFETVIWASRP